MSRLLGRQRPDFSRLAVLARHSLEIIVFVRLASFLALHIASLLAGEEGFNAVPYGGLDDGRIFYESARELVDGKDPVINNSYPVVLSWLFRIGIDQIWLIKLANTLAGIAAVLVLARMAAGAGGASDGDSPRFDRSVLLLVGLFPAAIFWSSNSMMRDAWIFLLVALALSQIDALINAGTRRERFTSIGALLILAATLGSLRWYAVGLLIISTPVAWATARYRWVLTHRALLLAASPIAIFLAAYTLNEFVDSLLGVRPLDYRANPELDGGSELNIDFRAAGSIASIPLYAWSVLSNAMGPFPWQARSPLQLIPFLVDLPIQLIILVRLWRHRATASRTAHQLWVFGSVWLLTLGLWNDSLGNATRIRVVGWIALAAATGAAQRYDASRAVGRVSRGNGTRRSTRVVAEASADVLDDPNLVLPG